jgi:hypothetical protein
MQTHLEAEGPQHALHGRGHGAHLTVPPAHLPQEGKGTQHILVSLFIIGRSGGEEESVLKSAPDGR